MVHDAYCKHPEEILKLERMIIEDHIAKHKWCNQIEDKDEAIVDFVHKFAWLMREVYCGTICPYREGCDANGELRKTFLEHIPEQEFRDFIHFTHTGEEEDLIKIKLHVIKHDLSTHKWLNKIGNYEEAVRDFLQKFGWLIFEMYKRSKKEET